MILIDDEKRLMVGDSLDLLGEILFALKTYIDESEDHDKNYAEWAKAVIVDQIQSGFDTERLDMYIGKGDKRAS